MPIPHADRAHVPTDKITAYLLNVDHPVGGPKATWFLKLGYVIEEPTILADDFVAIVRGSDDFTETISRHGVKYIVRGELLSPNQQQVDVVTVWIVESHTSHARLVTAYPAGDSR